jgi:hypothetical protein
MCFLRKVILKSDKAVASRSSLFIILSITVVNFINIYDEYFCKLMCTFIRSFGGNTFSEHHAPMYNSVFGYNMNFIEQNIHVLYNIKSYECHLMKIIKG